NDSVTVRGADALDVRLSENMSSPKQQIKVVSNPDNISDGSLAYVSDCSSGDIFRVFKIHRNANTARVHFKKKGNKSKSLSKSYSDQADVSAFRVTRYYIADSRKTTLVDG